MRTCPTCPKTQTNINEVDPELRNDQSMLVTSIRKAPGRKSSRITKL